MNLEVVVAVFVNDDGNVLIAKRLPHQYYGDYWEFPGGKIEDGEAIECALARECQEEVNLSIIKATPLIDFPYQYPERHVFIHSFIVQEYTGKAEGLEGQPVRWVPIDELNQYEFPPANETIVKSLTLALRSV